MKSKRISLIGLLTIMLIVSITLFSVSLGKNVKAELTTLTVTDTLGRYTGAVFTKSNVSTDDTYGDHVTESAPYNMTTALTESPKTMEVVVKLNSTTQITTGSANGKYGTVLGGYITNATKYTFNIEFDANRAPRLYYDGYSGSGCGFDFVTGVPIPANEWTRVTFVRDTTVTTEYPNGRTILYINGEYAAEKDTAGKDFVPLADPLPMIGADNRSNGTTSKKLQGALSYIGLSNEIKSEKEISEQYQRGENLVASTDADCIEVIDFCARTDLKAKYVGYDVPGTRITPYQLDHGYTESPKTFEAMIKLDASTAAEGVRGGTMLGGYQVGGDYHFNFEVYTNKQPRLWWWNASTGDVDNDGIVDGRNGRFDGVTLPDSEWVHLVIVRDTTITTDYPQGKLLCYVNGELKQTLAKAGDDFPAGTVTPNHWVGRDNRASQTFQGEMQYVTLSSEIKSATEIANAYKEATKVINSGDAGAMEVIESTSNAYQLDYGYTESPKTFEAMVKLNDLPANSNNRYGTMIGGYHVGGEHFNFEFFTNRYPRLWWRGNDTTKDTDGDGILDYKDAHFSKVTVPSGEWVHLVIVRDTVNNKMHCYVNGLLMQSVDGAGEDFPEGTVTAKHWIGQDSRTTQTFSGQMNYLALSSEIKSASEVLDAYKKQKRLIIPTDRDAIDTIDFFEKNKTQVKSFYKATNKITSTPNTFTATIKMPNQYTSQRVGVVYGTYLGSGFSKDAINYEFTSKGKLRILWMPGKSGSTLTGYDNYFSYNFEAGKTYHIAVVRDVTNKYFKLYVNGVWVENCASLDSTAVEMSSLYAPAIGADLRGSGKPTFLGTIYDVAVYSNFMTDAEVANEYEIADKKMITKTDYSGLLANWVLNSKQQKLVYDASDVNDVIDYSGNGNNAFICTARDYFEPETEDWFVAGEDEYTLIYLPDTQTTVHYHSASTEVMFDWITEYAKDMNLAFVMGLGDIQDGGPSQEALNNETKTGNPTYEQWRIMRENYKKLSDAGIAWSAIAGNHDYDTSSPTAENGRSLKKYNYWFNLDTLEETAKKNIVAVYEEGEMSNLIYEFSACGVNYLVVALEFGPSDDHLAWASSIISQPKYANHRILFNSHSILYSSGDFNGDLTYHNPEHYGWKNTPGININNGQQMWNEFVSKHDNMFITASGHIIEDCIVRREDTGDYGNNVLSLLIDGQGVGHYNSGVYGAAGDALVMVVKVNEKAKTMTFNYFNPENGKLLNKENQFVYDFSSALNSKQIYKDDCINLQEDYATIGSTVEFSITKASGYAYADPIVTDINGNAVAVIKNGDDYSFVMPETRVTISVEKYDLSNITLPSTLTVEEAKTLDLTTYFPAVNDFTLSCANGKVTINGFKVTGASVGLAIVEVTSAKYGEVATVEVSVTAKPVVSSSSSKISSSSQVETSSSSSKISSSSQVETSSSSTQPVVSSVSKQPIISNSSSSSKQDETSSSSSSKQEVVNSSSAISALNSSSKISATNKPVAQPSSGCGASFGGAGFAVIGFAILASIVLIYKKKNN